LSAVSGQARHYLGVDGGGTGCRARLETDTGEVLGQGLSGPAATRFGIDKAWNSIMTAVEAALQEAGIAGEARGAIRAGIGLAGLGRKGALEALQALPHPFARHRFHQRRLRRLPRRAFRPGRRDRDRRHGLDGDRPRRRTRAACRRLWLPDLGRRQWRRSRPASRQARLAGP
jgi:hypothetical protein